MSNSKKSHETIRQNEKIVKNSQKHDVNLRKNSSLYFQIGLIICLLGAYSFLEMNFETSVPAVGQRLFPEGDVVFNIPDFKPETPIEEERQKQKRSVPTNQVVEGPNSTIDPVIDDFPPAVTQVPTTVIPGAMFVIKKPEIPDTVPFEKIEQVPVFPGCEKKKTNEEKRECMSDKINQLVRNKFNVKLGSDYGLHGKQVIRTQFKIDNMGVVSDILVRSTHPALEAEAKRVIKTIPVMVPGKQRDKNVGVIYSLPIVFEIQD